MRKVFEKRCDHFSRNQTSVRNFPPVLMCVISVEDRKVVNKPPGPPLNTVQGSDARRTEGASLFWAAELVSL